MQQGPAGQPDGQVLAQLQRTQQELQASLLNHVLSRELLGVWGMLLRVDCRVSGYPGPCFPGPVHAELAARPRPCLLAAPAR